MYDWSAGWSRDWIMSNDSDNGLTVCSNESFKKLKTEKFHEMKLGCDDVIMTHRWLISIVTFYDAWWLTIA